MVPMIEAMACGTPVVAYGCGSAPAVIDEGVTGFIVSGEDQAALGVRAAQQLDRRAVRRRFDRRFSAVAMARGYLDIYADQLGKLPYAPELAPTSATGEKMWRRSSLPVALPPLGRTNVGLGAEPQPLSV